jgi:hypothetical protein
MAILKKRKSAKKTKKNIKNVQKSIVTGTWCKLVHGARN